MPAVVYSLLACGLLLYLPAAGHAEIFKYRDENGRLTFVDDKSRIPPQFREESTEIAEVSDPPAGEDFDGSQDQLATREDIDAVEAPSESKSLKTHQTSVRIQGNRVFIPVSVAMGNRVANLELLLDTGASVTVLHRTSLAALDLPSGKRYKARVAGGGTVSSIKIRFQHFEVGPFRELKPYAMVIDPKGPELPFDGMLGMDFLKDHPYTIDFENKLLTWGNLN